MAEQVGDSAYEQKFSNHDYEKLTSEPNDVGDQYPFSYPLLMEQQIRKLRHSLENWKEVVLAIKNVFVWEKQWHPTALIGASTICFTLLWLISPSFLTVFSLLGLVFTLCDYLIPSISSTLFKSEKWTSKKEREFEDLCTNLILYKAKLELAWSSYYRMRVTNRKLYFIMTSTILSILAWIGCSFNNLFLTYITVTFLLLFPGMEHNGIITKWTGTLQTFITEFINQARSKIAQQEKKEN